MGVVFLFLFFGHAHDMHKFQAREGSNLSHSGDNAGSLTAGPPGNFLKHILNINVLKKEVSLILGSQRNGADRLDAWITSKPTT